MGKSTERAAKESGASRHASPFFKSGESRGAFFQPKLAVNTPGDHLEPLTPKPIPEARFTDEVKAGVQYVYAVQAVDKAGNVSPASNRVEETARE